ncbi:uncharacterized protein [Prorops nasuta]|uniref:uncharacterized protein n=1 Tax=Prorops nasuta TaxID=863751 RepID=UPI0034CE70D0
MNLFKSSYYKVQKTLLSLCGAWPYQTNRYHLTLRIIFLNGVIIFMLVPQMIVLLKNPHDFDFIMACLPMLSGSIMAFSKGVILFRTINEIKMLFEELQRDWKYFGDVELDLVIIKRYAKRGKLITVIYTFSVYTLVICYYLVSLVAPTMDLLLPLNESRQRVLIFPGDFYGHSDDHFFVILTMEWYGTLCVAHLVLTVDALYMTFMLHACGMFAVLSERLERLKIQDFDDEKYRLLQDQKIYLYLTNCVKLHLKIIK